MVGGGGQGEPVRTRSGGAGPACWSAVGVAAVRRDGPGPGSRSDVGRQTSLVVSGHRY